MRFVILFYPNEAENVDTLTAAEIAERIRRPNEDMRAAGDRIRNWTREGLLVPVGEKNPGTGKVRRYAADAVVDAALLQTIVDCTGVVAAAAGEYLAEAKRIFSNARSDPRKGYLEESLLIMSKSVRDARFTMSHVLTPKLPKFFETSAHDAHTVISLKRLLDHLEPS